MEENQKNQPNNYEIERQKRLKEQNLLQRKRAIRRFIKTISIIAIIVVPLGGLVWYGATRPETLESDIISKKGLHWHPLLSISIKGQNQEIPADIGIGVSHNPVHTHDNSGVIHLEMQGLVKKDDLRLIQFFKVWGKAFDQNQILDYQADENHEIIMTVNGQRSEEYEKLIMRDGDRIVIIYKEK